MPNERCANGTRRNRKTGNCESTEKLKNNTRKNTPPQMEAQPLTKEQRKEYQRMVNEAWYQLPLSKYGVSQSLVRIKQMLKLDINLLRPHFEVFDVKSKRIMQKYGDDLMEDNLGDKETHPVEYYKYLDTLDKICKVKTVHPYKLGEGYLYIELKHILDVINLHGIRKIAKQYPKIDDDIQIIINNFLTLYKYIEGNSLQPDRFRDESKLPPNIKQIMDILKNGKPAS